MEDLAGYILRHHTTGNSDHLPQSCDAAGLVFDIFRVFTFEVSAAIFFRRLVDRIHYVPSFCQDFKIASIYRHRRTLFSTPRFEWPLLSMRHCMFFQHPVRRPAINGVSGPTLSSYNRKILGRSNSRRIGAR